MAEALYSIKVEIDEKTLRSSVAATQEYVEKKLGKKGNGLIEIDLGTSNLKEAEEAIDRMCGKSKELAATMKQALFNQRGKSLQEDSFNYQNLKKIFGKNKKDETILKSFYSYFEKISKDFLSGNSYDENAQKELFTNIQNIFRGITTAKKLNLGSGKNYTEKIYNDLAKKIIGTLRFSNIGILGGEEFNVELDKLDKWIDSVGKRETYNMFGQSDIDSIISTIESDIKIISSWEESAISSINESTKKINNVAEAAERAQDQITKRSKKGKGSTKVPQSIESLENSFYEVLDSAYENKDTKATSSKLKEILGDIRKIDEDKFNALFSEVKQEAKTAYDEDKKLGDAFQDVINSFKPINASATKLADALDDEAAFMVECVRNIMSLYDSGMLIGTGKDRHKIKVDDKALRQIYEEEIRTTLNSKRNYSKEPLDSYEIEGLMSVLKEAAVSESYSYKGQKRKGLYFDILEIYNNALLDASRGKITREAYQNGFYEPKQFKELGEAYRQTRYFYSNLRGGNLLDIAPDIKESYNEFQNNVSRINKTMNTYNDYMDVIVDIMKRIGKSGYGETGYNGETVYGEAGGAVNPHSEGKRIDYHSHPWQGFENLFPSADDIRHYINNLSNYKDKNGNPILQEAYISHGEKILKMDFSNIDWGKVTPEDLESELIKEISNAVVKAGGAIRKDEYGDLIWTTISGGGYDKKIAEAAREATAKVLSKYGGYLATASIDNQGRLIDTATKQEWTATNGLLNSKRQKAKATQALDVFDVSKDIIDTFRDNILKEILNTKQNKPFDASNTITELEQLIKELDTFAKSTNKSRKEWENMNAAFKNIRSGNSLNAKSDAVLNDLTSTMKEIQLKKIQGGLSTTPEYKVLQKQAKDTQSRLQKSNENNADYIGYATEEANKEIAQNFLKMIQSKRDQMQKAMNSKIANGAQFESTFENSIKSLDSTLENQMVILTEIINGTYKESGQKLINFFKSINKSTTTVDNMIPQIRGNANIIKEPKLVDESVIDASIKELEKKLSGKSVSLFPDLQTSIIDRINELKKLKGTQVLSSDYESEKLLNDQLIIRAEHLNTIIQLYDKTIDRRRKLAELEVNGDSNIVLASDQSKEEDRIKSIGIDAYGLSESDINTIFSKDNANVIANLAEKYQKELQSRQDKLNKFVSDKVTNGFSYETDFVDSLNKFNDRVSRLFARLAQVLDGTFDGDPSKLIGNVIKAIGEFDSYKNAADVFALKPIDDNEINNRLSKFRSLLGTNVARQNTQLGEQTRQEILDYINQIKDFQTNDRSAVGYEKIVEDGNSLREKVSVLEEMVKLYNETYKIRKEIIELETRSKVEGDSDRYKDYLLELKQAEAEIENQIFDIGKTNNVEDTVIAQILGRRNEIEDYAKSLAGQIEKSISSISDTMTRKKQQGYGYITEFESLFDTNKVFGKDLVQQLLNISDAGENTVEILSRAETLIKRFGEIKVNTQSNDVVTVKESQISSLLKTAENVRENLKGFGVSASDQNSIERLIAELKTAEKVAGNTEDGLSDLNRIRYDKIKTEINDVVTKYKQLGIYGTGIFDKIKKSLRGQIAAQFARYFSLYDIVRYVRTGINTIKELDTAMVELRKVTSGTTKEYEAFRREIRATAVEIASTNKDLISSAADWA